MPTAQKIRWARLRVGIMALAAMAIIGTLIFLLTGDKKLFSSNAHLYTYMQDSAAVTPGSPVTLNGITIGKVDKIRLSGDRNPQRTVRFELTIDADMLKNIPVDSVAAISAQNVLGTKYINIRRGLSSVPVKDGAELKALDTAEFEEVVQQSYNLLSSLQGILTRVDKIVGLVESGQGSIGKLLVDEEFYRRVLATVSEFQKVSAALNTDKGTIGKLLYDPALYNDVRTTMGRLDSLVVDLQAGRGTAGKFLKDEGLYDDTRKTVAGVRQMVDDLNAGKGTAGKLLKSEDLHDQLRTSLDKVNTMIDRINSGQGTIGQLLVNRQMYDNMNAATNELHALFKDIRANPKKFLRIKLSLF